MKQKPWDRYEVAFLLNYFLKTEAGDVSRKEAVEIVSNTLRKRAIARGIEPGETFRNKNGISMQMSAIRNTVSVSECLVEFNSSCYGSFS